MCPHTTLECVLLGILDYATCITYITDFQNLSMKAGMKEEFPLISQFSLGLDQKITDMILLMSNIPATIKGWVDQSKIFHTQKM